MGKKVYPYCTSLYYSGTVVRTFNSRGGKPERPEVPAPKLFHINWAKKEHLRSSAAYGFETKPWENKILFLTLTFPAQCPVMENKAVSNFCNNLRKTYKCAGYLWTREITKLCVPHYHMLASMPYKPIAEINDAWCAARGHYSSNAVQTDPEKGLVCKSYADAVDYATKYASKAKEGDVCTFEPLEEPSDVLGWTGNRRNGHTKKSYGISETWRVGKYNVSEMPTWLSMKICKEITETGINADFGKVDRFTVLQARRYNLIDGGYYHDK